MKTTTRKVLKAMTAGHATTHSPEFIVLDSGERFRAQLGAERTLSVSRKRDLAGALCAASVGSLWIVKPNWTDSLFEAASTFCVRSENKRFGDLLLLKPPPQWEVLPPLHSVFDQVIGDAPSFTMLPPDQLADVLSDDERGNLFIGGIIHGGTKTLTLVRGDRRTLTVPLSFFRSASPPQPDFQRFRLDDHGYSVGFGDYEASAHSILYGFDPEYRRSFNAKRRAEEQGFGPSLRRLRMLRQKSRSDFPGIAAKTIARIERGETNKPHGDTLSAIAKVLNVTPDEIENY